MSILRNVSACSSDKLSTSILVIFVTPSTKSAMDWPNSSATSSLVVEESSTVSCSKAAHRVSTSICKSAKIIATSTGWITKGSPDFLFCPLCALQANSNARLSVSRSSFPKYWELRCKSSLNRSSGEAPIGARVDALIVGSTGVTTTPERVVFEEAVPMTHPLTQTAITVSESAAAVAFLYS